jgi:hypothetical protein
LEGWFYASLLSASIACVALAAAVVRVQHFVTFAGSLE